jgi:hypothetical protein
MVVRGLLASEAGKKLIQVMDNFHLFSLLYTQ